MSKHQEGIWSLIDTSFIQNSIQLQETRDPCTTTLSIIDNYGYMFVAQEWLLDEKIVACHIQYVTKNKIKFKKFGTFLLSSHNSDKSICHILY